MHTHMNLAEQLHINEQNLRQRKQFLRLSQHEAELLRKYAGWAEQIAPAYAREFAAHRRDDRGGQPNRVSDAPARAQRRD